MFDEINRFIEVHNRIRYLVFRYIYCDKIKYLISEKVVLKMVLIIILE